MKKQEEICVRCKKNKATLTYTDSPLSFAHGFTSRICQECYNKQAESSNWFKDGYNKAIQEDIAFLEKYIDETTRLRQEALTKYGSISKIPKNVLVTLRINTVTEHKIRLEALKQKLENNKLNNSGG